MVREDPDQPGEGGRLLTVACRPRSSFRSAGMLGHVRVEVCRHSGGPLGLWTAVTWFMVFCLDWSAEPGGRDPPAVDFMSVGCAAGTAHRLAGCSDIPVLAVSGPVVLREGSA